MEQATIPKRRRQVLWFWLPLLAILGGGGIATGLHWDSLRIRYLVFRLDSDDDGVRRETFRELTVIAAKMPHDARMNRFYDHRFSRQVMGDILGGRPLHEAAFSGNVVGAVMFLRHGHDVNERDGARQTPLHQAVVSGRLYLVKLYISHGADLELKDSSQRTPLHVALGHTGIVRELLGAGARTETVDCFGDTPLMRAVACVQFESVQALLEGGADPNCRDSRGLTVLAASREHLRNNLRSGDPAITECLLRYGARGE